MAYRVARCAIWTRLLRKKAPLLMSRASGRSLARAAKAVSISAIVLALKTRICTATALAAASTSRRLAAAIVGSAGLSRTATRLAVGTSSRRNSSRLAANSAEKKLTPVALPPGRARLATRPSPTGSSGTPNTIGIAVVARSRRHHSGRAERGDHLDLSANEVGCQNGQPLALVLGPAIFDREVLALNIAALFEPLAKGTQQIRIPLRRCGVEIPNHRQRCLLRARRERPRRCAAEKRDEVAALHGAGGPNAPIIATWRCTRSVAISGSGL